MANVLEEYFTMLWVVFPEKFLHEYRLKIFFIQGGELKKNEICASSTFTSLGSQWKSEHINSMASPLSGCYSQNSFLKLLID